MTLVFIVVITVVVAVFAISIHKSAASQKGYVATSDIRVFTDIMDREVQDLFIAGLAHHCTKRDIGIFPGTVFNEKSNPVDKRAMAIYHNDKNKILGYIPGAVLDDYRKWCKRESCPCVGFIFWDGEHLRGRVRVYPPDVNLEEANKDATAYAKIANEHFGWE